MDMIIRMDVVFPAPFGPMKPVQPATRHDEIQIADRSRLTECFGYAFQEDRRVH
jgi:hypothetical protein